MRIYETTKEHAESIGAIAFFGDKYGDIVRVVEAGDRSVELCGGTHVNALGMIGPIKVLGESSIGANVRRIEALTATATLAHIGAEEARLRRAAELLRVAPHEVPERIERLLGQVKELQDELDAARARQAAGEAKALAAAAKDGVLVARRTAPPPTTSAAWRSPPATPWARASPCWSAPRPTGPRPAWPWPSAPTWWPRASPPPRWPPTPPRPSAAARPATPSWSPAAAPRWRPSRPPWSWPAARRPKPSRRLRRVSLPGVSPGLVRAGSSASTWGARASGSPSPTPSASWPAR